MYSERGLKMSQTISMLLFRDGVNNCLCTIRESYLLSQSRSDSHRCLPRYKSITLGKKGTLNSLSLCPSFRRKWQSAGFLLQRKNNQLICVWIRLCSDWGPGKKLLYGGAVWGAILCRVVEVMKSWWCIFVCEWRPSVSEVERVFWDDLI